MSNSKKTALDPETMLMTLDQLGQTIDIMTSVVEGLRGYITEQSEPVTSTATIDDSDIPLPHIEQSYRVH